MEYSRHRAITTRYNGFAFRSRLEARWAKFFDYLGVRWDYEPEGFELGNGLRYLPDFWLPDWKMWVEVKPDAPDAVTREKAVRLLELTGRPVYVTCGMPDKNGVLYFQDNEYVLKELPAFAYFGSETKGILTFGSTFRCDDEHRCAPLWVHEAPFDPVFAQAGARLRPGNFQDALFVARSARFEFNDKAGA